MRRLSYFLLLATAAAPALAAPGDLDRGGGRHHRDGSATEQSDSQPQRVRNREARETVSDGEERTVRTQRFERRQEAQQAQQVQPVHQDRQVQQDSSERFGNRYRQQEQAREQVDQAEPVRNWRRGEDKGSNAQTQSTWRERERHVRTIPDTSVVKGPTATERQAFESRRRHDYRNGNYTRWSNHWRHDNRYDWYNYRHHHRSLFRLGFYYDPFGWTYRRWSIGSYLYPSYYRSGYWLDDPWMYRLPPAYGPYRWVRYWDDALLVNIYTGEVVDVIRDFFW
jgi:hypothetical protein